MEAEQICGGMVENKATIAKPKTKTRKAESENSP
jgi:hypothetical protein